MSVEVVKIYPTTKPAKEAGLSPIEPLIEAHQTLITLIANLSVSLQYVPLELQTAYLSFINHLAEAAKETNLLTVIPESFHQEVKDKLQGTGATPYQNSQPIPAISEALPAMEMTPFEPVEPTGAVEQSIEETISAREILQQPEYTGVTYPNIWRRVKEGVDAGTITRSGYGRRTRYGPKEKVLALVAPLLSRKKAGSMEEESPASSDAENSLGQQDPSPSPDDLRLVRVIECADIFCVDSAALQAELRKAIRKGFIKPDECQSVTEEGDILLNARYPLYKVRLLADGLPKVKRINTEVIKASLQPSLA